MHPASRLGAPRPRLMIIEVGWLAALAPLPTLAHCPAGLPSLQQAVAQRFVVLIVPAVCVTFKLVSGALGQGWALSQLLGTMLSAHSSPAGLKVTAQDQARRARKGEAAETR